MIKSALADSTISCWQQTQTSDNALKKSYVTKFNRGGNFNKEKEAESGGNLPPNLMQTPCSGQHITQNITVTM